MIINREYVYLLRPAGALPSFEGRGEVGGENLHFYSQSQFCLLRPSLVFRVHYGITLLSVAR